MKKLKVGIIGMGVGEAHISGYLSHPSCEVISLCDFDDEVRDKITEKYQQYNIYKNADEILNDPEIDVVSIASYDNYHFKQIMLGIENNKHLFIEKPICLYENEMINIIKALKKKAHLKISSNLILRKSDRFIKLKNMIENNDLGEISYIHSAYNYGRINKITEGWRGKIDFYSVVYGGGVHLIDLILWLTGNKVIEVSAFGNNIHTKGTTFKYNDLVASVLKFENGMAATLTCNFGCVYPHFHQLEIYGTKATFCNDRNDALLYTLRDPKNYNSNKLIHNEKTMSYTGPKKIRENYKVKDKGLFLSNFIDSIIKDVEPEISKRDVFNALSVCFAIERAATTNKVEKVNYLYN